MGDVVRESTRMKFCVLAFFALIVQSLTAPCSSDAVCPDFDDKTVFKLTGPETHSGAPFNIVLSQVDGEPTVGFLLFASNELGSRVGSFTLLPGTTYGSNCTGTPTATLTHNTTLAWDLQEIEYTPAGPGPITFKGVAVTATSCNGVDPLVVGDETAAPVAEPTAPETGTPTEATEAPVAEPTAPETDAPVAEPTTPETDAPVAEPTAETAAPVAEPTGVPAGITKCLHEHGCMNTTDCSGIRRTYWESYCKMEALLPMWAWIAILSVGAVLILVFFICCCVCCCRKKDQKDESEFGLLGNQ